MDYKMNDDIELFIIWNKGRSLEDKMLAEIAAKYEIIQICETIWSKHNFSENLSRFYGKNIPRGCKKIRECGTGPFLVVIVRDPHANYVNGKNQTMACNKYHYRKIYGGGFLIHASDNHAEAIENFLFISGQNLDDFIKTQPQPWNKQYFEIKKDLIGTKAWKNGAETLKALAVLPNLKIKTNMDNTIWEVQTNNPNLVCRVLKANKVWFKKKLYTIDIGKTKQKIKICPFSSE